MKQIKSEKYWKKGKELVIDGTSLFSRGPRISVEGVAPKYISKAKGSRFITVDEEEYIDYGMAVGSVLLGHGYIDNDVFKRIKDKGVNLSLLSPYQVELAERLHKNIPSCGKLKFLSSGSEATESAVRIARIYTGRDKLIRDHYHGWISWCCPTNDGVPSCYYDLSIQKEEEDIEWFKEKLEKEDVAAVILEPMKIDINSLEKRSNYLTSLKKLCDKNGTMLIFDEVACGYRFDVGGAQKLLNVTPHISAFGKSISNGYPLSVVCCSYDIGEKVEKKLFVSSTFGGNPLALSAGITTLDYIEDLKVIRYIASEGKKLRDEINKAVKVNDIENVFISGNKHRLGWNVNNWDLYSLLIQEFLFNKIFFGWEIKNSFSHSKSDNLNTIDVAYDVFRICREAIEKKSINEYLKGNPIRPIL